MKCLIVGAGASIAPEISKVFRNNNYNVISVARKSSSVSTEIIRCSLNCDGSLNLSDRSLLEGFDAVVCCIGMLVGKSIQDYTDAEMEDTFTANIVTITKFIKYLLPRLNNNCSVVFLGSIAASAGSYDAVYSASKSALYGLTKSLAKNTINGVRFNCISPGLIKDTRMYETFDKGQIEMHISQTPTNQLITIQALAEMIYDICQPHWNSLNGQVLNVNGGRYV